MKINNTLLKLLGMCFISIFSTALFAQNSGYWLDQKFDVMGTQARVRFWAKNSTLAEKGLLAVKNAMIHVDNSMSPYKPSSLLSKVNREAAQNPVVITKELFYVVKRAQEISKLTHGAFDISFSSVGYLYDYRNHVHPDNQEISKNLKLIDYRSIILNEKKLTLYFKKKGMRIDLGGIAKGYSIDLSIKALQSLGIHEALVTAGGDTFALGNNSGKYWTVGIKHPRLKNKIVTMIPVADEAVSTSGDYERFFMEGNKRIHHIINPQTGKSASEVQSVTIIANKSIYADALSTSVFILGVEKGLKLIESLQDVSTIIVDKSGSVFYSSDLVNPNKS